MGNPVRQDEEVFGKDEGLLHEVVVTGRKVGTPSELRAFFAQLAHDEQRFRSVIKDVLGRTELTEAERLASEILGTGKVLGHRDVCRVWKRDLPEVEPVILFSEDILREFAKENAKGVADWRLIYVNGLSLREQREIVGFNRKKQPCFDPDYTWWLDKEQDFWATQQVESGYRLFDLSARFSDMKWQAQEEEITKLDDSYERAEEPAVTEICFSNFSLSPNKERLLSNWYHWGKFQTADGSHVYVGYFDQGGFLVNDHWDACPDVGLGVVLARKS